MTLRNCVKTVGLQRLVEIVSPPNSPIILAFGQLIAVTKFGRRSPQTGPQIMERYYAILSRCVRGISRKRCKIVTIADHSKFKSKIVSLAVSFISLVTRQCLRLPQLTSTQTNLLSSSSRSLKEYVLPPAMCRRRCCMFTMMHLHNFCQVSTEWH